MKRLIPLFLLLVASCATDPATAVVQALSNIAPTYDEVVLVDQPVAYWAMATPQAGVELSMVAGAPDGTYHGGPIRTAMPNGDVATVLDGRDDYLELPDDDRFSVPTTGILTVEAWFRPDTLVFPQTDGAGYVHWLGKGPSGQAEWTLRIYSRGNGEDRDNRISGYAFNVAGGLGVGSYVQRDETAGAWIHVVLVIDVADTSEQYPLGRTMLYRDGVLVDVDSLHNTFHDPPLDIHPSNSDAPLRIGTRDGGAKSHFLGGIGKVAIYDYALSSEQVAQHHAAMDVP